MADRQEAGQGRERAILAAARRVFTEAGYHGATMKAIAAATGVATGTLYLYFPSKEAVFLALIEQLEALVLQAIVRARAGAHGTLQKLAASIPAAVDVFARNRDLARIVLVSAPGAGPAFEARLNAIHDAFAEFVRRELEEAIQFGLVRPLRTEVAARAWVGTFYEVIMAWLRCPAEAPAGSPEALLSAIPALVEYNMAAIGARPIPPPPSACSRPR